MPIRAITDYVLPAKGLAREDTAPRIGEQLRFAVYRLEARGVVRKIIIEPEVRWELAERFPN